MSVEVLVAEMTLPRLFLIMVALFWWAGCASPPTSPPAPASKAPTFAPQYGRVVKVNPADRYVILECAVLPKTGEEFTLYRGNQKSGVVRIQRLGQGNFAAAELVEGHPMPGDWFRNEQPPVEAIQQTN